MNLLAYFLPGFHQDNWNDSWWGKGFTEWDNVKKSSPLYEGHIQPNGPLFGYYDLADKDVLQNSYHLASESGIDAFVIYDYWYGGQKPLGKIVDFIQENKNIDFSYSLCWANHSWTRSWKNRKGALDVLIEQKYSYDDELSEQIKYYLNSFSDERYFRVNDRPLFQIYKPNDVPNLKEFCESLREASIKNDLGDPILVGSFNGYRNYNDVLDSMDALVVSNPTTAMFCDEDIFKSLPKVRQLPDFVKKMLYVIYDSLPNKYELFDYEQLTQKMLVQAEVLHQKFGDKMFFSTFCGFDNTPRYMSRAKITNNVSALALKNSLIGLYSIYPDADLMFVNAWNEWGEGMSLEPSYVYGDELLGSINEFKQYIKRDCL